MKITLRLIVSLVLAAALVAAVSSYIQVGEEGNRMTHELDVRAAVIADGLQESIRVLLQANSPARLKRLVRLSHMIQQFDDKPVTLQESMQRNVRRYGHPYDPTRPQPLSPQIPLGGAFSRLLELIF